MEKNKVVCKLLSVLIINVKTVQWYGAAVTSFWAWHGRSAPTGFRELQGLQKRHIPAECTAKPCHCPSNEEKDCQQSLLLLPSQASLPDLFCFLLLLTPHGFPIPCRPCLPFTLTSQINQMLSEVPSNALSFSPRSKNKTNFEPITNMPVVIDIIDGLVVGGGGAKVGQDAFSACSFSTRIKINIST